jgi:hypothetical protein
MVSSNGSVAGQLADAKMGKDYCTRRGLPSCEPHPHCLRVARCNVQLRAWLGGQGLPGVRRQSDQPWRFVTFLGSASALVAVAASKGRAAGTRIEGPRANTGNPDAEMIDSPRGRSSSVESCDAEDYFARVLTRRQFA